MERTKKCVDCNKQIVVNGSNVSFAQKKFCDECIRQKKYEHGVKYRAKVYESLKIKKKAYYESGGSKKTCKMCGKEFYKSPQMKFCSRKCFYEEAKSSRLGKNNPAYRNGTRIKAKRYGYSHMKATSKYGKEFVEKHGYKYCEYCGINNSLRFETHHIVFASEMPKHKELHNKRNLILVCIQCHNNFHSGKTHEKRIELVKERKLTELFGNSIL